MVVNELTQHLMRFFTDFQRCDKSTRGMHINITDVCIFTYRETRVIKALLNDKR